MYTWIINPSQNHNLKPTCDSGVSPAIQMIYIHKDGVSQSSLLCVYNCLRLSLNMDKLSKLAFSPGCNPNAGEMPVIVVHQQKLNINVVGVSNYNLSCSRMMSSLGVSLGVTGLLPVSLFDVPAIKYEIRLEGMQ